jgi:hypothetical protein
MEGQSTNRIHSAIDYLKDEDSTYTSNTLKLLQNIGDYAYVIKLLQFNNTDLNISIQIPSKIQLI